MSTRLPTGLGLAVLIVAAACAPPTTTAPATTTDAGGTTSVTETDPGTGLPVIDPFDVDGDIVTAGSSTVFPLSEAVAALFEDEGYVDEITIDSIGSGAGLERFCVAGETDIANASRPIEDDEVEACREIGREPLEFRVGTDALAIAVSAANYFAESLTIDQIRVAYSTARTWADVDPSFPAHPIGLYSPGTDSGTFDYFVEEIFDEDPEPLLAADPELSEDDNVLVQGIAGDGCTEGDLATTCAIGYFGYAYYVENPDIIRALSVEGVEPSAGSVSENTYPLARPLFIYSDAGIMDAKPQVASFIAFYLNRVDEVIDEVGYFPAPEETILEGAQAWLDANG